MPLHLPPHTLIFMDAISVHGDRRERGREVFFLPTLGRSTGRPSFFCTFVRAVCITEARWKCRVAAVCEVVTLGRERDNGFREEVPFF